MFGAITRRWRAALERRMGDFVFVLVVSAIAALFLGVSLAFGTFAAYVYIRASEGSFVAALLISAVYALLAIVACASGVMRLRTKQPPPIAAATAPPSLETVDAVLKSLAAAGIPADQKMTIAAMNLARELPPLQLVALALVGGFLAARKLRK